MGSTFTGLIESKWLVSYQTSDVSNIIPLTIFDIFEMKIELPRVMTVRGQRSQCQLMSGFLVTQSSYLSPF